MKKLFFVLLIGFCYFVFTKKSVDMKNQIKQSPSTQSKSNSQALDRAQFESPVIQKKALQTKPHFEVKKIESLATNKPEQRQIELAVWLQDINRMTDHLNLNDLSLVHNNRTDFQRWVSQSGIQVYISEDLENQTQKMQIEFSDGRKIGKIFVNNRLTQMSYEIPNQPIYTLEFLQNGDTQAQEIVN